MRGCPICRLLGRFSSNVQARCHLFSTRSLDTVEDVMVGEVDELEEDGGCSISCLEGVIDVEEGKLEEELDDKL